MSVDIQWFQEKIRDRRMSQASFAKLIGMNPSSFSLFLNNRRELKAGMAGKIAAALGVTMDEVTLRAGVTPGIAEEETVKVVGYVDGEAGVTFSREDMGSTRAICRLSPGAVALVMRTTQTPLDAMNGWIAYADEINHDPAAHVDSTAIVQVKGHEKPMLRLIRRGSGRDLYTLTGISQDPIYDAEIEWLRPVVAFKPL